MALKELTADEIKSVSGGNANSGYEGPVRGVQNSGYGAQANGYQPNIAARGHGLLSDLKDPCNAAIASGAIGVAGAIASRSPSGIATAVGSAAVGIGSVCQKPSGSNHTSGGAPFR